MSDPQEIDRELREYLEKEPNLRRDDRLAYLKLIFHKHLEVNKMEHVLNSKDLFDIVSGAKSEYSNFQLPIKVSNKQVESSELANVAMIESTLSYLSRTNLLKRLVKFEYTK